GQHGERHARLRQSAGHSVELCERQTGRLGDVADGDPSAVFVLLGPPTDMPDIHVVAGGSEIEMHVDVDVELARHLEYTVDLAARIRIRVGCGTDRATTSLKRLDHQL